MKYLNKIISFIKITFVFLFGSLRWNLPPWAQWIFNQFKKCGIFLKKQHKSKPKVFYGILTGLVAVFIMGFMGYRWYLQRPQPLKLSVSASTINPTRFWEEDAKPDTLTIEFGGSAARLEDLNKVVEKGIKTSPKIEGVWKWISDNQLEFTIQGEWPVGQEIEIEFMKSLFPSHVHLEKDSLKVKTPEFKVSVWEHNFYQDPTKSTEKRVTSEVRFSHPVEPKTFEKNIKYQLITEKGPGRSREVKDISFTVSYDKFFSKAYLKTEVLSIPNYESEMVLKIDKGSLSKLGGEPCLDEAAETTTVPGMLTHFKFTDADLTLVRNEEYEPEQVLVLNTTAEVKQADLIKYLEVYILPKDLPAQAGRKKIKNYYWNVQSVSKEILKIAKPLELNPIPTELEHAKVLSFKYHADPGTFLYINVKKGLEAFGGYKLIENQSFTERVPEFPKELKIMSDGSLLSLSGDKKLSVLARDLEYVQFRAQRVLPGQIAHLITQSNGNLKTPYFSDWGFNLENMAETLSQIKALPIVDKGKTQYTHFDFSESIKKSRGNPKGLFYFTVESWDKVREVSNEPRDSRLILITDIGLITKKSVDGSYDVFLQSIENGKPLSNVQVDVIGKNGLSIMSKVSGADGKVQFPDLIDFKNEKEPVVFVAQKENDLSFIPINSHVYNVNYSRFDIGGVRSGFSKDQIESYLFSDRYIYRPGEEVHIGYVLKHSDWSKDLSGLNLEIQITDPKGSEIKYSKGLKSSKVGLNEYSFETGETWPTGTYNISLFLRKSKNEITHIGATQVKIEEFMPDRLKISARFSVPANKGWLHPENLKGLVNLQNLFGTAAQNRKILGEISLSPSYPAFGLYKEWIFHDPLRSKKSFEEELGEKTTDNEGNVTFDLGLEKFESASYLLRFLAEGFEAEGGRSVLASNSVLISPLKYLVGYKEQGNLNYINKDIEIGVDFIAIDPDLNKMDVNNLKIKTIEFRQVSTLVKQSNGTYKYESVKKEYEVSKNDFSISKNGTNIPLDTKNPGEFALVIFNSEGLELNRVNYSIAGSANLSFALEKNAELQVKLNKTDYNPGEQIQVSIRSPYVGAGLITIERDRVVAHKWFVTDKNSTVQTIEIPPDLEGNGYVNVTFVRSLDSNEIFMSPLSTGIAAFSINKDSRINKIELTVPDLVRPGNPLKMNISTKQAGKAIVFAVDEGILQVAKYQTPDPLNSFYKKKALEVSTRQILDLILPEFSKLEQRRSSEAGGAASLLGKNLNPFKRKRDKAVAYWSGVIDVGPNTKTLSYDVPDYFAGQLRVIAVAISQEAMDAKEGKTLVKGHFVLSPNIPNFVSPGDKFKISLGVSNNVEKSGKSADINIRLKTSSNIEILSEASQNLKIDEGSESSISFEVLAKEPLGNADFEFTATHKDKSSVRKMSSSVRPAIPYITTVQTGYVEAGDKKSLSTPRRMFKEFRTNEIAVSKLPLALANSFLKYLEKYPYGCTEQVISKGLPALVLSEYEDFKKSKAKVAEQVEGITEILASRQLPEGGFSKWPGNSTMDVFHSAYAAFYLTEAKDRGFKIPKSLMDNLLEYLKDFSEREPENLAMARVQSFAAYILARNEIIATKSLTSIEKWFEGYKDESWVKDITLLYLASAYKIMKADAKAVKLQEKFDDASEVLSGYEYDIYDESIKRAVHLYLVAKHFPNKISEFDGKKMNLLVYKLAQNYNTLSSAFAITAFEAYAKLVKAENLNGINVFEVLDNAKSPLPLKGVLFSKASFAPLAKEVAIDNSTSHVAYYSMTQAGFDNSPVKDTQAQNIEVFREFIDEKGNPVSKAKIGEELTVRIRARSTQFENIYNIAVVDLLPGGFEVVIDSVNRNEGDVDYVDIREDRMLLFQNFDKNVNTYTYKIKAVNKGDYQVPPIYSESMYDQSIRAMGKSEIITVE